MWLLEHWGVFSKVRLLLLLRSYHRPGRKKYVEIKKKKNRS
jgi:hypothetical protein